MRLVITGGAGFIGANLAVGLASLHPNWQIMAFDSLHRRGGEFNLERLQAAWVSFVHSDVRNPADPLALPAPDTLVECGAESSVMAGVDGNPDFLVLSNLVGAHRRQWCFCPPAGFPRVDIQLRDPRTGTGWQSMLGEGEGAVSRCGRRRTCALRSLVGVAMATSPRTAAATFPYIELLAAGSAHGLEAATRRDDDLDQHPPLICAREPELRGAL